ncbi:MAG: alpha/beta hydrolase [Dehalococcoidia bacterium]
MLLHDLTGDAHTWDEFAEDAALYYRVVAPDLRGHGQSGHAEDGYGLDLFTADVRALVQTLDLHTFDLVGHSLGALIAIRFAAERPELVNRLVLVDGGPGMDTKAARDSMADSFSQHLTFESEEEANAWYKERNPALDFHGLEQRVKYGVKQKLTGRWVFRHDPALHRLLADGLYGLQEEEQELWGMLAAIRCSILVLRGQESLLLSSDAAHCMVATASNATLMEIPVAGHSIPSEAPEQFRGAVLGFLLE